ncbi:hypothetical protein SDC9_156084 [bioreactor metagenome]|uniref:Uncharacterized protein n=1 Tax=bioreactor metagenome TaxID=1076179 RepID=A0A645F5U9_9ZZZZ
MNVEAANGREQCANQELPGLTQIDRARGKGNRSRQAGEDKWNSIAQRGCKRVITTQRVTKQRAIGCDWVIAFNEHDNCAQQQRHQNTEYAA